jgi:hypothetical protein
MNTRTLLRLAVLTAMAVGAVAWLYLPERADRDVEAPAVVEQLADRINEVQRLELAAAEGALVIERRDGRWVLADRAEFPVRGERVRDLVLALADLRLREPRTARSDHYGDLGLSGLGEPNSPAVRVRASADGGEVLVDLLIGTQRRSLVRPGRTEMFVLAGDQPQSWLADAPGAVAGHLAHYVDTALVALEHARVREVSVEHIDGERVVVHRDGVDAARFVLADLADDEEVIASYAIDAVVNAMVRMEFEDLVEVDAVDFSTPSAVVVLETIDGLRIEMELVDDRVGDSSAHYARLSASRPGGAGDDHGLSPEAMPEDPQAEVQGLNDRWSHWAFALAQWRAEDLLVRRHDLVTRLELDPPAEDAEDAGAGDGRPPGIHDPASAEDPGSDSTQ